MPTLEDSTLRIVD